MKKNALMAKPVNRFDVKSLAPDLIYTAGQRCRAFVLRLAEKGAGLITDDRIYVLYRFISTVNRFVWGRK